MSTFRSPRRQHDRQSFYKYTSAPTAKVVIRTLKLRWSSPLRFNDPFDVTQELRLNYDAADLNAALAEELADLIESADGAARSRDPAVALLLTVAMRSVGFDARRELARELRSSPGSPLPSQVHAFESMQQVWADAVPTFRIFCVSEANDVTPMWLHYADGYRGVVLELDCSDELDSALLLARPVRYQDEPPAVADVRAWARCSLRLDGANIWDLFSECEYIKALAWAYEREWRIVSYARRGEGGLFSDYPFHPKELSAVYLGESCLASDQDEILGLLTGGLDHVKVFRARREMTNGRFAFERIR